MGQKNEKARGLEADHHNVCKFTLGDPNWEAVRGGLEAVADTIMEEAGVALPATTTSNPEEVDVEGALEERLAKLPHPRASY